MTANTHILVFDSGLGGTTILEDIQKKLPDCQYSYALDNSAFPYSNKSDAYLNEHILKLFGYLIPYAKPDLVVIACNTASTLILDQLRQRFHIPFVGVVPAIKPAATLSKTKVIGLLATQATITRDYVNQLSSTHAEHCEIIRLGSQKLVEIAEQKMQGKAINNDDIKRELEPFYQHPQHKNIDVFILGCTHFPAIKEELAAAWPYNTVMLDSGEAIARRVADLSVSLTHHHSAHTSTLFLSGADDPDTRLKPLKRFGIQHCHIMEID